MVQNLLEQGEFFSSLLKGALMLGLENTAGRMANLARQQMAFGRSYDLDEILAGIEEVAAGDLQALATDLFRPRALSCGLVARHETVERLALEWAGGLELPGGVELSPELVPRHG